MYGVNGWSFLVVLASTTFISSLSLIILLSPFSSVSAACLHFSSSQYLPPLFLSSSLYSKYQPFHIYSLQNIRLCGKNDKIVPSYEETTSFNVHIDSQRTLHAR